MATQTTLDNQELLPLIEDHDEVLSRTSLNLNSEQSLNQEAENQEIQSQDFIPMEKNIAAFGFFTPTSKNSKKSPTPKIIQFSRNVGGNRGEAKVTIAPNILHGMPTTADQDKYFAFQKILENIKREKGKIENPITFTSAEMLQMLGQSDGGANFKEVEIWCDLMNSTFIKSEGAVWIAGKKKFASDSFVIFQRVQRSGQELDDGKIADRHYIWLSDWYLDNINFHYLLPIDFDTYKQLKHNIAKALIPLLQVWLYASRDKGVFEKRYDEICEILNITKYFYISKIREKLSPSFNELVDHKYISHWEISKTKDNKEYKIIFTHGEKFYQDNSIRMTKKQKITAFKHKILKVAEDSSIFNTLTVDFGIIEEKANDLLSKHPAEIINKQVLAFPYRGEIENKSGFLIRAIENNFSLPKAYFQFLADQEREEGKIARENAIKNCSICDVYGNREVKSELDPFFGVTRECTHDFELESQYEDHII